MTNDILEQIGEEYFRFKGYFTKHNVKYRPKNKGNYSDIDIVAFHPIGKNSGLPKVCVASCKAWHGGLDIKKELKRIKSNWKNGKIKKVFREIALRNWSKALKDEVKRQTGTSTFTFYLICVKYDFKRKTEWENYKLFTKNLTGCRIELLDMKTMVNEVLEKIETSPPEHSELTRLLQLIKASKGQISYS